MASTQRLKIATSCATCPNSSAVMNNFTLSHPYETGIQQSKSLVIQNMRADPHLMSRGEISERRRSPNFTTNMIRPCVPTRLHHGTRPRDDLQLPWLLDVVQERFCSIVCFFCDAGTLFGGYVPFSMRGCRCYCV